MGTMRALRAGEAASGGRSVEEVGGGLVDCEKYMLARLATAGLVYGDVEVVSALDREISFVILSLIW